MKTEKDAKGSNALCVFVNLKKKKRKGNVFHA